MRRRRRSHHPLQPQGRAEPAVQLLSRTLRRARAPTRTYFAAFEQPTSRRLVTCRHEGGAGPGRGSPVLNGVSAIDGEPGTADELSCWSLAPLISPARWQLTLCSDQTRLSHSSAIPKQQMGRAFSSIGFKQVCRALVDNLDIMCVLSVAAPPGRTTTVSTDVNERSVADESV